MYKYTDHNQNGNIILHDCRATHISRDNDILIFRFADGIYMNKIDTEHPFSLYYTGEAEVHFRLVYKDINLNDVYVFNYDEEKDITIRETWEFKDFIDKINNGMELEFLTCYKGHESYLFECCLWFNDENIINRECMIIIEADEITYCWNEFIGEESR